MYVFAIDTQYIKFESLKYQRFFFSKLLLVAVFGAT